MLRSVGNDSWDKSFIHDDVFRAFYMDTLKNIKLQFQFHFCGANMRLAHMRRPSHYPFQSLHFQFTKAD